MATMRSMFAAGAVSLFVAAGSAHADTRVFDLNRYDPSLDPVPNQTLAVMQVTDIAGGGVEVTVFTESPAVDFGPGAKPGEFTLAIQSNLTSFDELTLHPLKFPDPITNPVTTKFPATGTAFGDFTAGANVSVPYNGVFDFKVLGHITTAAFTPNADRYYVTAFVDLPNGAAGQIGGGIPEPSAWAMMLMGFAGLGFIGYRGRKSAVAAA